MYILGINAFHGGASACLIKDGQLIAAAEEERFNRIKYWAGFPVEAIRYVLTEGGITPADLDHVGISRKPNARLFKMALYAFRRRPSLNLVTDRLRNVLKVTSLKAVFAEHVGVSQESLHAEFHNVEHHRAHMASAFFVSPFDDAAILSIDGAGDFVTTMWGTGKGNSLEVAGEINFPHSLGIFYTAISQWLGFQKYGDEGKVMGLAPYGNPDRYLNAMRKLVRLHRDGTFDLDLDYFIHHAEGAAMTWASGEPTIGMMFSPKLIDLLGEPRVPRSEITQNHHDVAAALQLMLEEAEFAIVRKLAQETGKKALCMAGGVALNSAFNGKILPQTEFTDISIHPAAGDAGTSLGVCYYIYHQLLGKPRTFVMHNAYTGSRYDNGAIQAVLDGKSVKYEVLEESALVKRAAEIVAEGNVMGWFQGRMEWGPRALGARSIIADPRRTDMKDILNARIKHREAFRPFAPSILLERTGEYFDQDYPDPFMIKVYGVRPEKQAEIPAVTHVDGTGRLQTVEQTYTPLYHALIHAFGERTGTPVVLNTSFNENEPIVRTPKEALDCFLRTRMDALVMGNYVVVK
ncbi:MAG TPA: carbamoyltransferase C-terminal domain-containing protein [Aggregatilineales bacterium]|nr:carbamoyltransferase [Anaerolineales bacterium]HRE48911.1 carbamoyltransferase C-terminal domain-containing protein [Aggregatilineales bacterium]